MIAARADLLKLIVNNKELEWSASGRFKPGDKLDFRVESSIFGRALVPLGRTANTAASSPLAPTSPRLLSLLHRPQQPSILASLFKQGGLDALAAQLGGTEQLRANLLMSMAKLSPQMVKRGLSQSGLFGEQRLASGAAPAVGSAMATGVGLDIKQMLRSLLRNTPVQSPLSAELKGAIDEVESKQLETLQAQQSRELSYSFVLPFMDANAVEIELYHEARNGSAGGDEWVINLHTDSPSLGELWLKTTLKSAANIEMVMWAPRLDVAERAREASSELAYELQCFGLSLEKIDVLNAPRPALSESLGGSGQVVDVST